jgi:hypothetical protein
MSVTLRGRESVRGREHVSESEGEGVHVSDREGEYMSVRGGERKREGDAMLVRGRETPCQ